MVQATVKGGFWGDLASTYTTISGDSPTKRRIAALFNKPGMKALREIAITLNGATAGSTAAHTRARIKAVEEGGAIDSELGGDRTIETVTDVNRATDAADVTELNADIFAYPLKPSSYPANRDGNPKNFPGG